MSAVTEATMHLISLTRMTEQQAIEAVLSLYTKDNDAVQKIGVHVAAILQRRRSMLRRQRAAK